MPTYQYACTECGERLEVVQKFSDEPLTVCPSCQGKLRKLFSAVGVVFKGSGFYKTDSRSSGGSSGGKTPSSTDSDTASSASGGGTGADTSTTTTTTTTTTTPSTGSSGSSAGGDGSKVA